MKLLFVIKTLALPGGGAERVLAEVTKGLAERGHEVVVASFDLIQAADFYCFHRSVRRLRLGIGPSERPSSALAVLKRVAGLRRLLREERPDVVVGFMHSAYVPLALALPGTGVPAVASEHIVPDHYYSRPVDRTLLRFVAARFKSVTAVSEQMKRGFPTAMQRKMVVIPNPVQIGPIETARTGRDVQTLLTVGRLEPQKDHRVLIEAFARIMDDHPAWTLRIVGEGRLRYALEQQVAKLGVGDRVKLPGPTASIDAEYRAADLFVMPSRYESFGIATAEALAHGLAAVGFADCPGTNDLIVDGENGLLVAGPDRAAALAQGLSQLMGSHAERARMGAAGPRCIAAFSPNRIADQWEAMLEAVTVKQ